MSTLNDFIYTDGVHDVLAVYVNRLLSASMRSEYKNTEMLAADRELTDADTLIQRFDCDGTNRVVSAPAADAVENHPFFIVNGSSAGETITVKNNAVTVTLITLAEGKACLLMPDGAGDYLIGIDANEGLTSPVGIADGGTGQTTANAALDSLTVQGTDIASAGTTNIAAATGLTVTITGSTTITAFGTAAAGVIRLLKFSGAPLLTYNATSLKLPGATNYQVVAGDVFIFESEGSGNWKCIGYTLISGVVITGTSGMPAKYQYGMEFSNNVTDATNDIDISAGGVRDSSNTVDIVQAGAFTKRFDAGWAAGTNQGIRNSAAALTNTTYHVYAVSKALGADPDYYGHTSASVSTVLTALQAETGGSAYIYAKRIFSVIRVGGVILQVTQNGNKFRLKTPVVDQNTTLGISSTNFALASVPTGITVEAGITVYAQKSSNWVQVYVRALTETDAGAAYNVNANATEPTGSVNGSNTNLEIMTDTSTQIAARAAQTSTNFIIISRYWIDTRDSPAPGGGGGLSPAQFFSSPMPENLSMQLDQALSADGKYTGFIDDGIAGAILSFGNLLYFASDSKWKLADADAAATAGGVKLGMCVLAAAGDGSATKILRPGGKIRADSLFPTMTVGAPLYVGTNAGAIQTTAPSGAADIVRIVGHANTADELDFNPSPDWVELV